MKKLFTTFVIFTLIFAACDNGNNNETAGTTLAINNLSDYNLFDVEYFAVDFGTINSGKDVEKDVSAGTKYVFFSLQTVNGKVRCRTEALTCVENSKSEFTFTNNTIVVTAVTERQDSLKNLFNTLNNELANPKIRILYENYPVVSGGVISLYDIAKGQKKTISLKIVNEGEHDLQITGTKPQISGVNAAQVVAGNYPSVRLAFSESAEFSVEYTASVNGANSFVITIINNDQTNGTYTVNVTATVANTWQKLYGETGKRSGIYRAISNGSGGMYGGGYTSNNTAALFNIDQYGNLQNSYTFNSFEGTIGPNGIGSEYNNFYAVFRSNSNGDYFITKTNNPAGYPILSSLTSLDLNGKKMYTWPNGIICRGNYYFVAGNAEFYNSPTAANMTMGIFVSRHNYNGDFEMGIALPVSLSGITSNSYMAYGMTMLSNGDVLLYGEADRSGRRVAFACAVNVSAVDSALWNVRWSNYYDISGERSFFVNHFWDNSSNILLVGFTDSGGFVVKFPANAATAANAKPAGWPKYIAGTDAAFTSGLAITDGSGYLFVGVDKGSNGEQDVWVVKTDENVTTKQWEKFFGGTGDEFANEVVEQSDGFIIAGSTMSPTIAGQTRKGTEDIYILKINKDGTMD